VIAVFWPWKPLDMSAISRSASAEASPAVATVASAAATFEPLVSVSCQRSPARTAESRIESDSLTQAVVVVSPATGVTEIVAEPLGARPAIETVSVAPVVWFGAVSVIVWPFVIVATTAAKCVFSWPTRSVAIASRPDAVDDALKPSSVNAQRSPAVTGPTSVTVADVKCSGLPPACVTVVVRVIVFAFWTSCWMPFRCTPRRLKPAGLAIFRTTPSLVEAPHSVVFSCAAQVAYGEPEPPVALRSAAARPTATS
jgi:hypothetical protein